MSRLFRWSAFYSLLYDISRLELELELELEPSSKTTVTNVPSVQVVSVLQPPV